MIISELINTFKQNAETRDDMRITLYGSSELNFVEFNITGDKDTYSACNIESQFLHTKVFNLFMPCFQQSNKIFDYFEPTRFSSRSFIVLNNNLKGFLRRLEKIDSPVRFTSLVEERPFGKLFTDELKNDGVNLENDWEEILSHLIAVNKGLIDIVCKCVNDSRELWVIGY